MDKFSLPALYTDSERSVWVEYNLLAQQYNPVNLGQGFPDFAVSDYITKNLIKVATSDNALLHQYARSFGHPRLVNALSKLYSKMIGREINPQTEILVTSGAYEALFTCIIGHVGIGDEVIIIEPFFDCYQRMVKSAGGVCKFILLKHKPKNYDHQASSADWILDKDELESLFNNKTKAIILNTPHNPLGKVFTLEELQQIADLCKKWNVLCISDEVSEWLVYKGHKHIRIATLPNMWERTITVGSGGKTFSVTGWKIGWAYGPAHLMYNLQMVHQNCVYNCATPAQEAIAMSFELELQRFDSDECYFKSLPRELEVKRDFMGKFLTDVGMKPNIPDGGYFIVADWSSLASKVDLNTENDKYKDYRFTKWMIKNVGLLGIPQTVFYSQESKPFAENLVRYCFNKSDETLQQAADIFKKIHSSK